MSLVWFLNFFTSKHVSTKWQLSFGSAPYCLNTRSKKSLRILLAYLRHSKFAKTLREFRYKIARNALLLSAAEKAEPTAFFGDRGGFTNVAFVFANAA